MSLPPPNKKKDPQQINTKTSNNNNKNTHKKKPTKKTLQKILIRHEKENKNGEIEFLQTESWPVTCRSLIIFLIFFYEANDVAEVRSEKN